MNNYTFYIEFEDGDEVRACLVSNSVPEASEQLFESEEYKRFAAGRKVKKNKIPNWTNNRKSYQPIAIFPIPISRAKRMVCCNRQESNGGS